MMSGPVPSSSGAASMPTNLADAPPGEIGDPGPDIADLELDRTATWSCYQEVRRTTEALCAPLEIEDYVIQSMPDASPTKWHLAHTSWFFEKFVLEGHAPDYRAFDPSYSFLFNSYYDALGSRQPRPLRGLITRPTLEEVLAYRAHVDAGMEDFWRRPPPARVIDLIELGCHHEQQHQELILTDILHLFAQNPLRPVYRQREKGA